MSFKYSISLKNFLLALYLLICGYFIWSVLTTAPMMWDDYQFHFTIRPLADGKFAHIGEKWQNFNDFFYSFIHHRDWQNSRIPDYIFLLIAYYGNMVVCAGLNAIVILVTWIFLTRITCKNLTVTNLSIVLIVSLLLLATPDRALLWRAACLNYAWGCLLLLLLLAELNKSKGSYKPWLVCLLSFLCGAWHEGLAAPLMACFCGYVTIQFFRKEDRELKKYILTVIFCFLGFLILLSAPVFQQGRANTAATNIVNLNFWVGSIYRVIQYASPAIAAYVLTVWLDRKNIRDNKLFYLATANLVPTVIIFARGGSWGGGCFFCTFSILLYTLNTVSVRFKNREGILRSGICMTASIALLAHILGEINEEKEYFNAIMAQNTNEPVRRCDYLKAGEIPWTLKSPFYFLDTPISTASVYYDKPMFTVIFNQMIKDESIYSAFNLHRENETTWKKFPEYSIIRLAKGVSPVFEHSFKGGRDTISNGDNVFHLHSSFTTDWLARVIFKLTKKQYITTYYSYHQGHYFVVLSKQANKMDTVNIKTSKDNCEPETITIHPEQ